MLLKWTLQQDWREVSEAVLFWRYPNPWSHHVLSVDTLGVVIDKQTGKLSILKVMRKRAGIGGRASAWITWIASSYLTKDGPDSMAVDAWVAEEILVDGPEHSMHTLTHNLNHRSLLSIREECHYTPSSKLINNNIMFETEVSVRASIASSAHWLHAYGRAALVSWAKRRWREHTAKFGDTLAWLSNKRRPS